MGIATVIPMHREIPYVQPAALHGALRGNGAILLESVRGPFRIARYSFVCVEPHARYRLKNGQAVHTDLLTDAQCVVADKPLKALRNLLGRYSFEPAPGLPPFQGGAAGLFSYDFAHYIERLPKTTHDDLGVPDADLFFYDRVYAFDHKEQRAWAIVCPSIRGEDPANAPERVLDQMAALAKGPLAPLDPPTAEGGIVIRHDVDMDRYTHMVRRAKEYIAAGDIFQANLSLRVSAEIGGRDPWGLYLRLRDINPSPFACYMDMGDYQIASSSPERLVMVRDGYAELRPIAGTRPRGENISEDEAMRRELLLNEKERAEHIMLIDLERNDIGRVCDYGTVHVDELMITEDYSHVIHIVSNVRGKLARGRGQLDVLRATFPGGTITGVPKIRCMQIIDELESFGRGPYTGSVGYMGYNGQMDLNIIIRTFAVKDGRAYVQAGAGIVADSVPEREYRESLRKAEALIKTLSLS